MASEGLRGVFQCIGTRETVEAILVAVFRGFAHLHNNGEDDFEEEQLSLRISARMSLIRAEEASCTIQAVSIERGVEGTGPLRRPAT